MSDKKQNLQKPAPATALSDYVPLDAIEATNAFMDDRGYVLVRQYPDLGTFHRDRGCGPDERVSVWREPAADDAIAWFAAMLGDHAQHLDPARHPFGHWRDTLDGSELLTEVREEACVLAASLRSGSLPSPDLAMTLAWRCLKFADWARAQWHEDEPAGGLPAPDDRDLDAAVDDD